MAQPGASQSFPAELVIQTGHSDSISALTFSHDGRLLATAGNEGSILIWNVATGQVAQRIQEGVGAISEIAFSHDDRWLAVGASWYVLGDVPLYRDSFVWDLQARRRAVLFKEARGPIGFAPSGQIVSGRADNTLWLWSRETGLPVRSLGRVEFVPSRLQVGPDADWLVCACSRDKVDVRRLSDGSLIRSLPSRGYGFELSANGALLAVNTDSKITEVFSTRDWSTKLRVPISVGAFAFSADNRMLFAQETYWIKDATHHRFRAWDLATGRPVEDRALPQIDMGARATFRNASEIAIGDDRGEILIWNLATTSAVQRFNRGSLAIGAQAVSPDSASFATGRSDGRIVLWSADAGRPVANYPANRERIEHLAFSPDAKMLVASSGSVWSMIMVPPKPISVVEPRTGARLGTFDLYGLSSLAIDRKSQRIAVTNSATVEIRQLPSGQRVTTLEGHDKWAMGIAYSPDGRWLASGGGDGRSIIWDAASGKQVHVLRTQETLAYSVAFSPDSSRLATSATEKIKVWDVATGKQTAAISGHSGWTTSLAWSPDGRRIVSGGWDHNVHVWDAQSGALLHTLSGHSAVVRGVAFVTGGLVLGSADDGTSKLWDPRSGELLATLMSFAGSDDWLVVSPSGLFDGTADAMQLVAWRMDTSLVPLDSLYNDFFHPDLLGEIFDGERPRPVVDVATVLRLPGLRRMHEQGLVHIERRDGTTWLCVAEESSPAVISDIRVYRAGAAVILSAGGFLEDEYDPRCRYRKQLPDGAGPWELTASSRRPPSVGAPPAPPAMTETRTSALFVYTVGIKTYDASVRYAVSGTLPVLPYAALDADAVERFFAAPGSKAASLFRATHVLRRRDTEATRQAIRDDLASMARQAAEDDVVVIFFAGHGRVPLGQEMFYFVPYVPPPTVPPGVDRLSVPPVEERQAGISTAILADAFRDFRARRVIVVIDACQSGGAVESFQKIGDVKAAVERRRSRRQGATAMPIGVHVLAAATPLQEAISADVLQRGLLTTVFLEGLNGALARDRTSRIGAYALVQYVSDELPKRARQHGWAQTTLSVNVGADFPLANR
jgi:WD40 repeat protein